jgi:hypothetical protein
MLGIVSSLAAVQPLTALPIQYDYQAFIQLIDDVAWGLFEPTVTATGSVELELDGAEVLAGGTVIDSSTGAVIPTTHQAYLFSGAALEFSMSGFGSASFSRSDLVTQTLGDTGLTYEWLVLGRSRVEDGLFHFIFESAKFAVEGDSGHLSFGNLMCTPTCVIDDLWGEGQDPLGVSVLTFGVFLGPSTPSSPVAVPVPEPTTISLLAIGMAGALLSRRRSRIRPLVDIR